jgi:hypothetical protein
VPIVAVIAVTASEALQQAAATEAGGDDLTHREVRGGVVTDVPGILEFAGAKAAHVFGHGLELRMTETR